MFARTGRFAPCSASPSSSLHIERGVFYYLSGDCEKAIADCVAGIRLAPRDFDAYASRGYYYLANGDPGRAIADENHVLDTDGERPGPHDILARAYVEKGDADKALDEAGKALQMEPTSSRAHAVRGLALDMKGEREKAKAEYAQAVRTEAADRCETQLEILFIESRNPAYDCSPPGYDWLRSPKHRELIGISLDHERKLVEISDDLNVKLEKEWAKAQRQNPLYPDFREYARLTGECNKLCQKQIEEVLTVKQLAAMSRYSPGSSPQLPDQLVRKRDRENTQSLERFVANLTVQQRVKLRAEIDQIERDGRAYVASDAFGRNCSNPPLIAFGATRRTQSDRRLLLANAKWAEFRKADEALQKDASEQIERLLTPEQLALLQDIQLQRHAVLYVADDPVLWDKVGITELQKATLEKLLRDMLERAVQVRRRSP